MSETQSANPLGFATTLSRCGSSTIALNTKFCERVASSPLSLFCVRTPPVDSCTISAGLPVDELAQLTLNESCPVLPIPEGRAISQFFVFIMEAKQGSVDVEVVAVRGNLQAYLPKWNSVGYQVHISRRSEEAPFTTADVCQFALEVHRVFKDQLRLPTVQLTLTDIGPESEAKIECSGDQREYLPGVMLVSQWQQPFQEAWQPEPLAAMATFLKRALEKPAGPSLRFEGAWELDGDELQLEGKFVYSHNGVEDDVGPRSLTEFGSQDYREFLAGRRNYLTFSSWDGEVSIEWHQKVKGMICFTVARFGEYWPERTRNRRSGTRGSREPHRQLPAGLGE